MDEQEIKNAWEGAYSPPSQVIDEWGDWAGTIEFKLSRQGQLITGLAVGLGVTVLLVGLQGKVTINLVKIQAEIVNAINSIVDGSGNTTSTSTRYSKPSGTIQEDKVAPIDPDELAELQRLMDASGKGELPEFGG